MGTSREELNSILFPPLGQIYFCLKTSDLRATENIKSGFSEPQGMCYIETANLDGETNLKIRQGVSQTCSLLDTAHLQAFAASIDCEPPHFNLYDFSGTMLMLGKSKLPLGPDQLLLRGAKLKNTNWVFGLVVYTGVDTKLMQNSNRAPLKRSSLDKATNSQVLILFALLVGLCFISAIFNAIWNSINADIHTYLKIGGKFKHQSSNKNIFKKGSS